MSGTVSTRWFWSDWMSDPGLRACSYAARGLWKDLLCIAGSNKAEYGFVSLNGKKLDPAALAKMTNGTEAEVDPLLAELKTNGVYSVDRRGVIYCRRMVRAEKNRRNGRLGGNPKLLKQEEKPESVRRGANPPIPKPEPSPEKKDPAGLFAEEPVSDWPKDYHEQFWALYPKRTEKKAALTKLDAVKRSGKVRWEIFRAGIARYARHVAGTEERYIKQPTTWLNRGCWEDEFSPSSGGGERPKFESRNGSQSLLAKMLKEKNHGPAETVDDERALPAGDARRH